MARLAYGVKMATVTSGARFFACVRAGVVSFLGWVSLSAQGAPADTSNSVGTSSHPPAKQSLSDSTTTWLNGEYFTGEWSGVRKQLASEGVTPYFTYDAIMAGNVAGGLKQGSAYGQNLGFGLTFDMQKLVGWKGATININGVDRAGATVRQDVGNLYDPMQLVGGSTAYLYDVTLEQKFLDDIGSFKFGRLSAGDDFASSPLYGYYLNNGIDGQIKAVVLDTRFSTYPYPVWGSRLRFDPSPEWNVMTGVYQVSNTMFDPNYNGLNMSFHGGVSVVQEVAWTPEFDKRSEDCEAKSTCYQNPREPAGGKKVFGMPGHYALSGYWSDSSYSQFGTSMKTNTSYGFFAQADQMVYREAPGSDQGLYLWTTLTYAPQQNIAIIPVQVSGGLNYKGLIPGRPDDRTIFGFIYGHFSYNYAKSIAATGGGYPTEETVYEFGYRVQATQWAYIQPDLQYITNPYGTGNIPNAVVIGAQFGLVF